MDLVVKALLEQYVADTMAGAGAIKGDKGDKGDTGEISVGTVASGTVASVVNSGTSTNAVFDFVLPKGDKGDTATVAVGSVASGSVSSVTNSGTNTDAIFDFVLEKGDKGDKGISAQIFVGTDITGDVDVIVDVATSNVGDLYINSDTSNLYKRTDKLGTTNLWEKVGNIKGQEGDDAYEVAVSEGFIGTRAEWLESLHGEATNSYIVWEKPNIKSDDVALHTWYYYKIDTNKYESGSAWLNRFNIPNTKDYPAGNYAFFNGINYLCFGCNTPIPALTTKDTTKYYVLYNEKTSQCQGRIVDIASGTETSLNWTDVTVSATVPDGYMEVFPDGEVIQYGQWVQTIYLGSSKASAYDCTISTGVNVSGFITSEAFRDTIGSLGLLTTTDKTNLVNAINEVNGKFSNYIPKTDIVDSLASTDTTKPLSANKGKELHDKLEKGLGEVIKKIYPIGSIYINVTDVNPLEILGFGTWERVAQNMTLWGASDNGQVGTTKSAGLPNITGFFGADALGFGRTGYGKAIKTVPIRTHNLGSGSNTNEVNNYQLDASLSNSIYGNSDTVQPPALVVNIWKRTA